MNRSIAFSRFNVTRACAVIAACFLSLVVISGCDDVETSTQDFLANAKEFRQKGDLRASVIEAKNVLRSDANNQEARLLLGLNYMDAGAWAPAEAMLEKAMEGASGLEYAVIPPLMRVKLNLGKFDDVLDLSQIQQDMSNSLKAEILALRGRALTAMGKHEDAQSTFGQAIALDAKSHNVFLGLAGLALVKRDIAETERLTAAAAKLVPDDPEVLRFRGRFSLLTKQYARAKADFEKLTKIRPFFVDNKILYARSLLLMGDLEPAAKYLDELLRVHPNDPKILYFRASAAIQLKDYQTAATLSERALAGAPGNLAAQRLAGLAFLATGRYEQSRTLLAGYLERNPSDAKAAKLMAVTQLKLGMNSEALATLKPMAEKSGADAKLLTLIGAAAIGARDFTAGENYFSRIVTLEPENAIARTRLGLLKMGTGKVDAGIDELTSAVRLNGGLVDSNVALITNLIRLRKNDEALEAALRLQANRPNLPEGSIFVGIIQLTLGRQDEAKASFERALEQDPGNPAATLGLSNIFQMNNQDDQSAAVVRSSLERHPKHTLLLLRLAKYTAKQKDLDETQRLLNLAVEASPHMALPRLRLGRLNLLLGKPEEAVSIVAPALKLRPNDGSMLEVSGKAQLALKRYADAKATFEKLVSSYPNSSQGHFFLAQAHKGLRNLDAYVSSLRAALSLNATDHNIRIELAKGLMTKGRLGEAGEQIDLLKKEFSASTPIILLEADHLYRSGNFQKAADLYQTALNSKPSIKTVSKLARAHWEAGKKRRTVSVLTDWLTGKPDDFVVRLQLAEYFVSLRDWAKARSQYEEVIKTKPNVWLSYNQLAWVLLEMGELEAATRHAERARELAPRNPQVMDTMAWVLLQSGEKGGAYQALQLLKVAATAAPQDPAIKFRLAQALVKNGKSEEAFEVLNALLSGDPVFKERPKAEALLKQLGG